MAMEDPQEVINAGAEVVEVDMAEQSVGEKRDVSVSFISKN
jgi:hypothetical protein